MPYRPTNKTIAFVCSSLYGQIDQDDMWAASALRKRGYTVDTVLWDAPETDWTAHDIYINRSTWGYQHNIPAYKSWVKARIADKTPLLNSADQIEWNLCKSYLGNLASQNAPVAPFVTVEDTAPDHIYDIADRNDWQDVVLKPLVNAAGFNTYRFHADKDNRHKNHQAMKAALENIMENNGSGFAQKIIVQPFIPEITTEGEWSFVFFNNRFSHALLKRPAKGNFLVQKRWGGHTTIAAPTDAQIIQARSVLETLDDIPLYARVDGVFHNDKFALLELELNEPYLFFGLAPFAAERFADAVEERLAATIDSTTILSPAPHRRVA